MGKNILVLGMSTLPINRNNGEIGANKFIYNGCGSENGIEYYSQLEPVSRMIREKKGSLDQVVIFATPEVKKKCAFKYNSESIEESAIDFYLRRMEMCANKHINIIDVDDLNTANAIFKAVETIKKFWNDNDEPKLWIDTQGGFRNLNLVVNAIISLLKADSIVPSGIYSVKFNNNSNENPCPIIDQTRTYKIFDFVSGINEFTRYGRADQLGDYYKSINQDIIPDVISKMKKITDNIQMCDMRSFDEDLADLADSLNKNDNNIKADLLDVFIEQIRADYGSLLNEHTGLDVVEWLYKKKFYQQAITYIESKMPREWVGSIISYGMNQETLFNLKDKMNKKWESDQNFIINQIVFECFFWRSIVLTNRERKVIGTCVQRGRNLKTGRKSKYMNDIPNNEIVVTKNGEILGKIDDIKIKKGTYDDVMNLFLLYKLLKNERNNFNHMSSDENRADFDTLGKVINKFIEIGRKVYAE